MSWSIEERLKKSLQKRRNEGNLRTLGTKRAVFDFFSNDYLGLAHNPEIQARVEQTYRQHKNKITGATGSRLLSGNTPYYEQLESKMANIFKGESALIFNSGYTANLAVFSSIPQKGDTIIYDELIHACIKEGSRLSFADRFSFKHNDEEDLESKLKRAKGEKFVAIESVYSMDGDFAPIKKILEVTQKYNAHLIIDEAHSTGVFGMGGNGLACDLGIEKDIFIRTYTFGKAIGSHGACVVSSNTVSNYLVNFARSFIYTTALPLHNLVSIEEAFDFIYNTPQVQSDLKQKITYFNNLINIAKGRNSSIDYINSLSAIQAIVVPGNLRAKALSLDLNNKGFDVRPILNPTVQEGKERLRICLHVYNTDDKIENLVKCIEEFNL